VVRARSIVRSPASLIPSIPVADTGSNTPALSIAVLNGRMNGASLRSGILGTRSKSMQPRRNSECARVLLVLDLSSRSSCRDFPNSAQQGEQPGGKGTDQQQVKAHGSPMRVADSLIPVCKSPVLRNCGSVVQRPA
jgi:hypothetical protein